MPPTTPARRNPSASHCTAYHNGPPKRVVHDLCRATEGFIRRIAIQAERGHLCIMRASDGWRLWTSVTDEL
jgi:hypothetical protein